jgi:triacylglycerol lipase
MLASLSPPRRRLILALAAILAAAALAVAALVGVRALGGADDSPRGSGPPVDVQQDEPGPVLLVPGYGGATGAFGPLQDALEATGRVVRVVELPGDGQGDMREQARVLAAAVDDVLRSTGAGSVDVVGYSAGGVVARLWAQELGGSDQARRIMTLGSPHHGTQIAALAQRFAPDQCPEACRQLVPGSDLLDSINSDETPSGPAYIALWTTKDQMVTPPESGRLDGAQNIELQSVCGDSTVSHGALPRDPLVIGLVLEQLSADPVTEPTAADCTALRSAGTP